MTNNNPFSPWWYYEMGKDTTKQPNQKISNGAFAMLMICLVVGLILFGIAVAVCVCIFTT